MSISDLNTPVQIMRLRIGRDRDGFPTESEDLIACVRARAEMRNATEKWNNRAVLREASSVFTFRHIPHIEMPAILFGASYSHTSTYPRG